MDAPSVAVAGGTVVADGGPRRLDVLVEGDRIAAVGEGPAKPPHVVDASGCLVLPGLVNGHAHGCTTGPLFSSAAAPLSVEQAQVNAERHLSAGVTTLVNVCGFGLPEDVPETDVDIRLGTTHFPAAVRAAETVDAGGLDERHRAMTARGMLEAGAVALGEIGSGATLGGGVAAYRYVPDALEADLGRRIDPAMATRLIDALIGPGRVAPPDDRRLAATMADEQLPTGAFGAVREAILRYALAPVHASLESFAEAAALSERTGAPAIFHAARPSGATLLELAHSTGARIVAGHMNHTSFSPDETVQLARSLRAAGAVIDVSSLDIVHARKLAGPEDADALAAAGLVDTLTTDYAGGAWETMLGLVQRWLVAGLITLEQGVAMCSSTPARIFGFGDRGRVAVGLRADLVIVSENDVSDVRVVVVGGRVRDYR